MEHREEVKNYLCRYLDTQSKLKELNEDIERLELKVQIIGAGPLSERLDAKRKELRTLTQEYSRQYAEAVELVETIQNENQRRCMKLRFLENRKIKTIAAEMHYDERSVLRHIAAACDVIVLPAQNVELTKAC